MKRLFLSALFTSVLILTATAQDLKPSFGTVKFQGETREYLVYIPKNLSASRSLLIMLHGHGGNAAESFPAFYEAAEKYGFALCIPQGLKEPGGERRPSWNVGYPMQEGWKVDDCKFVIALAKKLQKRYSLNSHNLFLSGMSNGGEMCYYMASRYPEKFAAIASLAGLNMEWIYRDFKTDVPVPFFEIHGTEDMISKWEGDPENNDGWGKYVSVPAAIGRRVSVNCCTHEICDTLSSYKPGSHTVVLHRYVGGTDGKDVLLYEVIGGGHDTGEKDIDLPAEMWKFFCRYMKSGNNKDY